MSKTKLKPQSKKDMETAIKIIAVCEAIRIIQITIDMICGAAFKRATLKSIKDAKKSVEEPMEELSPGEIVSAILEEERNQIIRENSGNNTNSNSHGDDCV